MAQVFLSEKKLLSPVSRKMQNLLSMKKYVNCSTAKRSIKKIVAYIKEKEFIRKLFK